MREPLAGFNLRLGHRCVLVDPKRPPDRLACRAAGALVMPQQPQQAAAQPLDLKLLLCRFTEPLFVQALDLGVLTTQF